MAEPGFFGSLANTMQSPLFLGGVGLLSGGGMQGMSQGIQTGILGQRQQFDQEQQRLDRMRQQQQDAENMRRWNTTDARAAALHPGALDLQKAQAHLYHGRASAQDALANVRDGRQAPEAPDPVKGWGMDENNDIVPPRGPAIRPAIPRAVPALTTLPDDVAPRKTAVGRFSPGTDADGVGRFSPGATMTGQAGGDVKGQSGDDQLDSERQNRLRAFMERQQALTHINGGKPPSGTYWTGPGTYASGAMKDTATERATRMHAAQGIQTLDQAEKLLNNNGTWSQIAGDTYNIPGVGKVGGFGEAGRGFRAAESAVLQLNFALSGKSVSNAEREEFQRIYRPTAFDSAKTQQWKISEARKFFHTVLDARRKGMDDDRIAELYRAKIADAAAGISEGGSSGPKVDPVKQRLMNKYGLE